jgi:hypothetical protein
VRWFTTAGTAICGALAGLLSAMDVGPTVRAKAARATRRMFMGYFVAGDGKAIVTRTIFAPTNALVTTLCGKTAMS